LRRTWGCPCSRINELVKGRRGITPETAWMLGRAFKVGPEFWMNLQTTYDLAASRHKAERVKPVKKAG
jgi:addiction module HigA family antidote